MRERDSEGCITTTPGDYKVTFNIKTGEFTAVPADGTGVDAALSGDDLSITIDKGILTVTQSASRITVYMANGSHILTAVDTHIVTLSALSRGIYILKIETPDETKSYKISL